MYQGWYGITSQDRVLHAGAFNWTYTLGVGLTDPWANGATAIVYTGKERHAWVRLVAATQATIFAAVPTLYRGILRHETFRPQMLASLRHGLTAGEALPLALAADWEARTGKPLYEALGMSELSTYISSSPGVPRKPGMVGKPQAGRRVAIVPVDGGTEPLPAGAEGLIAADRADPGLMLGYWNRPEEEAEMFRGPWFVSGDLGAMDHDGYIAHRGRANDLIKALGYRVSPMEIEAVLARHPAVAEAACAEVRLRDVSLVGAWIVAHAGAATDEAAGEALKAYAREHLAAYKVPRIVTFVASLPRTANGKVKRSELKTSR
jgi:acyl-coenzyme A synthetase/AMP-(fatty) acid ligase